jgi:hypothetical protein
VAVVWVESVVVTIVSAFPWSSVRWEASSRSGAGYLAGTILRRVLEHAGIVDPTFGQAIVKRI